MSLNPLDRERMKQTTDWAAEWWTNQLRGKPLHDNGGRDFQSGMAMAMMSLGRDGKPELTEEQLATFKATLSASIFADLEKRCERWDPLSGGCYRDFGTDYHATPNLVEAGRAAGVDLNGFGGFRLPLKTWMQVHPYHVVLGAGYGAEFKSPLDLRTNKEKAFEVWESAKSARVQAAECARYAKEPPPHIKPEELEKFIEREIEYGAKSAARADEFEAKAKELEAL